MGMEAGLVLDRVAERLKYEVSFFCVWRWELVVMTVFDNQWFNVEYSILKIPSSISNILTKYLC